MAGRFEFIMTTLKLIPLVIIPLVGFYYIDFSTMTPFVAENFSIFGSLKASMFLCIWAFIGLETATVPSAEVKNASKIVPLATMVGTILALVVYLLGFGTMLGLMGPETLSQSAAPYADLAAHVFGGQWAVFISIAAIICCLGSFNGWTLVVSRVAQGAAQEKLFPSFFAKTDKKGTPWMSLIISSMCTFPLLIVSLQENLVDQFNAIIDISITLILLIYLLCVIAYFVNIRHKVTPFKALVGVGALGFVGFCIWAAGFEMLLMSCGLLVLGLPMRLVMQRQAKKKSGSGPLPASSQNIEAST
jgi:basic amino acid/polyamine antiporter, APA family